MKKWILPLLFLALALTAAPALGDAQPQVIAQQTADLNGDGMAETVALVGVQTPDSIVWQDVKLSVRDGASDDTAEYALPEDMGYGPRLWVGSLTALGARDILVSMESGGSGGLGYYTVFAPTETGYEIVFGTDGYNAAYGYTVSYQDGYAIRAESLSGGTVYMLSLAGREKEYLADLYQEDGTLKAPAAGDVNPLGWLYPADLDGDGLFELVATQRITGLFNADGLGEFVNVLAWNGETFILRDQSVRIFGSQPHAKSVG